MQCDQMDRCFEAGTGLDHLRAEIIDIEALARAVESRRRPRTVGVETPSVCCAGTRRRGPFCTTALAGGGGTQESGRSCDPRSTFEFFQ